MVYPVWKTVWQCALKLMLRIFWHPAVLLLHNYINKNTSPPRHALRQPWCYLAPSGKIQECPLIVKWLTDVWQTTTITQQHALSKIWSWRFYFQGVGELNLGGLMIVVKGTLWLPKLSCERTESSWFSWDAYRTQAPCHKGAQAAHRETNTEENCTLQEPVTASLASMPAM